MNAAVKTGDPGVSASSRSRRDGHGDANNNNKPA
jgi:hypothetical protein